MRLRDRVARLVARSSPRQSLLFVSPVVPSLHGNGLAMRAAFSLLGLATRYRVTLVVLPLYGSPAGWAIPAEIRSACVECHVTRPGDASLVADGRFDVVHVFRLGTIPHAEPWLRRYAGRAPLWLDLDDVESIVHRRMADLHRLLGDKRRAGEAEARAREAEAREVAALTRFDRVFLASVQDVARLPLHGAADVRVLPNVLPLPESLPDPPDGDPITILFVGTLGYLPNVDGALWFAREVLPHVQRTTTRAVEFEVVGAGWLPQAADLKGLAGVRVVGPVPEIRTWYQRAHLAVVPLRAGGGTRIKVIEAFGLGRPVVATTIGVEGIDASDEEQLLIADDPVGFARACARLIEEPLLGAALTRRARDLARERYSPEALAAIIADWPP